MAKPQGQRWERIPYPGPPLPPGQRMPVNPAPYNRPPTQTLPPENRPEDPNSQPAPGAPGAPGNPIIPHPNRDPNAPPGPGRDGQIAYSGGPDSGDVAALQGAVNTSGQNVGVTPFGQSPGITAAGQRIQGSDITGDPAIAAALAEFQRSVQPGIQNQAALAGLGNSSAMTNSLGQAQASMMLPLYMDAFQREGHRLDNTLGATESELSRRERSDVRQSETHNAMIDRLMQLQQMGYGQQSDAARQQLEAGGVQRDVVNEGYGAEQEDFLRTQGLSENALYQPFGGTLPAGLGSLTTTKGK